jgi:hypothetical protein
LRVHETGEVKLMSPRAAFAPARTALASARVAALAVALVALVAPVAAGPPAVDYPFGPVPFTQVALGPGLWHSRLATNGDVTVWYDFKKCEETGRIDNFAKAGKLLKGEFRGIPFDDSDVFKVIEGASYTLAIQPDPKLEKYLDDLVAKIAAAQEPDGYLYSARTIDPKRHVDFFGPQRWTRLEQSHELYNVGHLYEAAVAHHQATGKRSLLEVALKNAELIERTFGPGPSQRKDPPGHQEIEIGLVKLYRATGEKKYLTLARFFLDQRGRAGAGADGRRLRGEYQQDHKPVAQQQEAVGHAVRACYMYSGMADVAALTGDAEYLRAIDAIWENVVSRKMYLTGGVGSRGGGEAFGDDYELPNREAYNETCAAIAHALWNERMFLLHGDGKYIDGLERILYNGFLAGVGLSGDRFFYPNPLAADGRTAFNHGSASRSPWFGVSCCPVNVVRFIPSVAGFAYATRGDAAYVNLFLPGKAKLRVGGRQVQIEQATRYPWDGRVEMKVTVDSPGEFSLLVRIPGWAQNRPVPSDLYSYLDAEDWPPAAKLSVNGEPLAAIGHARGYVNLRRTWKTGDTVVLELPMPVRRVAAHEKVEADRGRVALERGPIVYCLEGVDHGGHVADLLLPDDAQLSAEHRPDLLGGVTVVSGTAKRGVFSDDGKLALKDERITAVPYFAWAHRGQGEMEVWIAREESAIRTRPKPTIANQSRPSASHCFVSDSVGAMNDDVEPKNSGDHGLPRFTWWDRRGTTEWVQLDFAGPATVSQVEVYWFDDTGRGACRVPASWKLLYRDGDEWKEVPEADGYGVEKDRYNVAKFKAVKTQGLRIEARLRENVSGGVLEWKVK